jgi:hypothetical protein
VSQVPLRKGFTTKTRCITLVLGAAGGGPMAVAFADDYGYAPDPSYTPVAEYTDGIPPVYQDVLGYDKFDWVDETQSSSGSPDDVGTFNADTSDISTSWGFSNQELLVDDGGLSGTYPAVGSVFDVANFGSGFENIYSDLVGVGANGANLITDVFDTPFGDFAIPTTFDAAALAVGDYFP